MYTINLPNFQLPLLLSLLIPFITLQYIIFLFSASNTLIILQYKIFHYPSTLFNYPPISKRDADEALDKMDGVRIDGREIRVSIPSERRGPPPGAGGGGGGGYRGGEMKLYDC